MAAHDLLLQVLLIAAAIGLVTVLLPDDIDPRLHLAVLIATIVVTVVFVSLLGTTP